MERMILELRGISCIDFETVPEPRKQIIASRSFGERLIHMADIEPAVLAHAGRAGEKLRRDNSVTACLSIWLETDKFKPNEPQYNPVATCRFPIPTDDTRDLATAALGGFRKIFKDGFRYKKTGVMLQGISQKQHRNGELFAVPQVPATPRSAALMQVMDRANGRYGSGTVGMGVITRRQAWDMQRNSCTPPYTTDWKALPCVR
jgi:DNA polymerase V